MKKINYFTYTLLLVFALLIGAWPTMKLWPAITYNGSMNTNIDMSSMEKFHLQQKDSNAFETYESKSFHIYISKGYMNKDEVSSYVKWLEKKRVEILDVLEYDEAKNFKYKKIGVYVMDKAGIAFSNGNYFVVYDIKSGLDHTVHEMTHSLDFLQATALEKTQNIKQFHSDANNSFFYEQTAVMVEDKIGSGFAYPNYGMPINSLLFSKFCDINLMNSMLKLKDMNSMMIDGDYFQSETNYLLAGSFAQFLFETYGAKTHQKIFTLGYEDAYGKTFMTLQNEWREWLEDILFIQVLVMSFAGLVLLRLSHIFIVGSWTHLPVLAVSMYAYAAWLEYLSYSEDLYLYFFGIIFAILFKQWIPRITLALSWIIGVLSLILFVILPLLLFFP